MMDDSAPFLLQLLGFDPIVLFFVCLCQIYWWWCFYLLCKWVLLVMATYLIFGHNFSRISYFWESKQSNMYNTMYSVYQ